MTYTELHFEAALIALLGLGVLVWILTRAKPRIRENGSEEPRFVYLARRYLFVYMGVSGLVLAAVMAGTPHGFGLLSEHTQANVMFDVTGSALVVLIVAVLIFPGIVRK